MEKEQPQPKAEERPDPDPYGDREEREYPETTLSPAMLERIATGQFHWVGGWLYPTKPS